MTLDLGAPASVMARLSAGVRDDQLSDPTPCEETDVAGILAHIIGLSVAFRDGAAKVGGPTTSTPPGPVSLPDDWREQLPLRVGELAQAWRDPAAWEGETTVGGATQPAPNIAGFANDELVLHAWDLASATGQPYEVAPENLEAAWQLTYGPTANLHFKVVHIEGPNGERIDREEIAAWFKARSGLR